MIIASALPKFSIFPLVVNNVLNVRESFLSDSGAPLSSKRMAKLFEIMASASDIMNTLYLSLGICFIPYKAVQITVQLAAMYCLVDDFATSDKVLPKLLINALSISRLFCETMGTKVVFVQIQPSLGKIWFTFLALELMSRAGFIAYQRYWLEQKTTLSA